jgi:hypothetical protein
VSISLSAGRICKHFENAFQDAVDCICNWKYFHLAFAFKYYTKEAVNLVGISGVPEYSGAIDLNQFQLGLEIKAKVCIKEGNLMIPIRKTSV